MLLTFLPGQHNLVVDQFFNSCFVSKRFIVTIFNGNNTLQSIFIHVHYESNLPIL